MQLQIRLLLYLVLRHSLVSQPDIKLMIILP